MLFAAVQAKAVARQDRVTAFLGQVQEANSKSYQDLQDAPSTGGMPVTTSEHTGVESVMVERVPMHDVFSRCNAHTCQRMAPSG